MFLGKGNVDFLYAFRSSSLLEEFFILNKADHGCRLPPTQ